MPATTDQVVTIVSRSRCHLPRRPLKMQNSGSHHGHFLKRSLSRSQEDGKYILDICTQPMV